MPSAQQLSLFYLGVDLSAAYKVKLRIMQAQLAANTLRNYRCSWFSFERWCRAAGNVPSLPAEPRTCIDHCAWCISEGLRLETVELRLKAISHYHRASGLGSPCDLSVRAFIRNARRDLRERPQGKTALSPAQLRLVSQALKRRGCWIDARDRAFVLLGFALGWRSDEIVSLDLRDVRWVPEGITVWLGKSKTDQEGRGRSVGVQRGRRLLTCPIRALNEWIARRGRWAGPLFTSRETGRQRPRPGIVRAALKRGIQFIGDNPRTFGAHSLRSGMITSSIESGATETSVMQRTGQKSYGTLRRYVRAARVFQANPLKTVL